jgi:dethiobiotin synthetase
MSKARWLADRHPSFSPRGGYPVTLVISGTDTGVGKTWVGCLLARAFAESGRRVVAVKPVETGCSGPAGQTEDGLLLARATGQREPGEALVRLCAPVAAPEAAEREGRRIDFAELVSRVQAFGAGAQVMLVEGAGGLLSPITWEESIVDFARALEARVLLVAMDCLGTINHSLMALRVLEQQGIETVGIVLSAPAQPDASTGTNARAISRISGMVRIACVPRLSDASLIPPAVREVASWL